MKLNTLIGSLMLGTCLCAPSFGGGLLDRMLGLKGSGCDSACCDTGCAVDPSCGCEMAPACGGGCEPTCGVEMSACGGGCAAEPTCGVEMSACGDGCGAAPTCGCELSACGSSAPSCGCEISSCDPCGTSCKPRRKPLLELLGKVRCKQKALVHHLTAHKSSCDTGCAPSCGCEIAAPTCGCEISSCEPIGCDSGCGTKKCGGLLSKLFQRKTSSCDSGCGIGCDSGCSSGCSSCGTTSMPAPISAPTVHGDAAPMPPAPVVDPSAYLQSNRRVIQATSYVR